MKISYFKISNYQLISNFELKMFNKTDNYFKLISITTFSSAVWKDGSCREGKINFNHLDWNLINLNVILIKLV